MPILGIWASQISGRLWQPAGAYDSLATIIVPSSGVSSVTFSSIPTGYKHLQIRFIGRSSRVSSDGDYMKFTFNSDTGSNYSSQHWTGGDGSGTYSAWDGTATGMYVERLTSASQLASTFGVGIIDILDYSSVNKNKTLRCLSGGDVNGSFNTYNIRMSSSMWMNSSTAVSSISIIPGVGPNFVSGTQFALYGVK